MLFKYRCLEAECLKQEHEFEFHHIPRDEPAHCNRCSSQNVEKLFAPKVSHSIKGDSAANNYGLRSGRKKRF